MSIIDIILDKCPSLVEKPEDLPRPFFSRDHDKVWVKIVSDLYVDHFPSDWSNEEIEEWVFLDDQRYGKRVLRREIAVQRRELYKDKFTYGAKY